MERSKGFSIAMASAVFIGVGIITLVAALRVWDLQGQRDDLQLRAAELGHRAEHLEDVLRGKQAEIDDLRAELVKLRGQLPNEPPAVE